MRLQRPNNINGRSFAFLNDLIGKSGQETLCGGEPGGLLVFDETYAGSHVTGCQKRLERTIVRRSGPVYVGGNVGIIFRSGKFFI